mmetsp:Transcript_67305/g.194883  ORF Transcript_67305/g.194883 Transcript_67305/m.194883 type:complete len:521 (+) Transcript_67305:129-1691(+)
MVPSDFVVKVDLDGDMRRFRFQATESRESTWAVMRDVIHRGYELAEGVKLRLTYQDDEGDTCTLTETTFPDCVAQAGAGSIRLRAIAFMPTAAAVVELHTFDSEVPPPADHDAVTAHPGEPKSPQAWIAQEGGGDVDVVNVGAYNVESRANGKRKGKGKGKGKRKMMCWAAGFGCDAAQPAGRTASEEHEAVNEVAGDPKCLPKQCWSPVPWKLVSCLGGLNAVGKFNDKAVASLAVHFLPTLGERVGHRKERLNEAGLVHREALLPMLHRVLIQLEAMEGTEAVKQSLESYCSGEDVSKLGETMALLLQTLVAHADRASVITLIRGASEELVDLLPRLFPGCFAGWCMPASTHVGAHCEWCDAAPLVGPRFHDELSGADFCSDCFVDQASSASADFQCQLWSFDLVAAWRDAVGRWSKCTAADWSAEAAECKGKRKCKGKGKDHGKAKGKGKMMWFRAFGCDATQQGEGTAAEKQEVPIETSATSAAGEYVESAEADPDRTVGASTVDRVDCRVEAEKV